MGKKCSLIFMRKVGNRLVELEERYKDLSPKEHAGRINEQLLKDFCVRETQIKTWKRVVKTAENLRAVNCPEKLLDEIVPTTLFEIARLTEAKQLEVAKQVVEKNLTARETKMLVDRILKPSVPLPPNKFRTIIIDPPWNIKNNPFLV